jgi:dihydrofolate reductase
VGTQDYDWDLDYHKESGSKGGMVDTNYVFSRKPPKGETPGVKFVSEPVKAFARDAGKTQLDGGRGEPIVSFLDAGEIDEFDIHAIPS